MSTYIQNYGFTKTIIKDNKHRIKNEMKWIGDYDGNIANIELDINDNGSKKFVSMKLDNNDIRQLFGIQPVDMSLDKRIMNDFDYNAIALEGALFEKKKRRLYKKTKRKTPYKKTKPAKKIRPTRRIR